MNPQSKQGEIRLTGAAYAKFKREILERDNHRCQNPACQHPGIDPLALTIEHIIPRSRLRLDVPWNTVIICAPLQHGNQGKILDDRMVKSFPNRDKATTG